MYRSSQNWAKTNSGRYTREQLMAVFKCNASMITRIYQVFSWLPESELNEQLLVG